MNEQSKQTQNEAPKKLGRYRILHEVGRGATAFVYKAYDPQLDRFLAIKVLRKEQAKDQDYREAFIKEARLAAQLTHPGIVTIYDVGITDEKPYIAMELLEGATLEQILTSQGKLNLRTVLAMAQQLSRALNYAHKQGVVHRDIKPGNIVVLKDKKTVKLTDFGIAQLDETLGSIGKGADKVLGTPEYMAPEQILGQKMDNRSDIYSFGVLLYRMLSGIPPFKNDDLGLLFKQIVKSNPQPLLIEEEKVRDDIQDLIRKLLQKRPEKRFQSAAQITAELSRAQAKLSGQKKAETGHFVSLRLRWTATMAGVVFLSMCISLVIVYVVQNNALSGITYDYARSIAQMLVFESAEPILLDDQVGLNAIVQESKKNKQLVDVNVMNTKGQVLASFENTKVGKLFVAPSHRVLQSEENAIEIFERSGEGKQVLIDITIPIEYSDKVVGSLYVTFNADSMYAASKTTLVTMLVVMMITLVVVFVITLTLARQTSNDYKRITQALRKLALGRHDSRLLNDRNDETGALFDAFNDLAESVEAKSEPLKKKTAVENFPDTKSNGKDQVSDMEETIELNIEQKNQA